MPGLKELKDTRDLLTRPSSHVHWLKLLIAFAGLVALSFAFGWALELIRNKLGLPLFEFALLAYVSVFVASLLANMTILAPVPFAVAIMVSAARDFSPVTVAFFGALGGTLGELSGYYAGRLGKRFAIPDTIVGYQQIERWMHKYGMLAVMVIAFQPIIPFDVGGLIAGAAKMPLVQFLPALFAGKFPKYIILIYAGLGLIGFIPSCST